MKNTIQFVAGDFILESGTRWWSRLIKFGTMSPYSHVSIVISPEMALGIEANPPGVRAFDLRKLNPKRFDIYRVNVEYDLSRVISFLVRKLGKKYDWLGVTWLGLLKISALSTGRKLRPDTSFQKKTGFFCSELLYKAFIEQDIDLVPSKDHAHVVEPGDFAKSPMLDKVEVPIPV